MRIDRFVIAAAILLSCLSSTISVAQVSPDDAGRMLADCLVYNGQSHEEYVNDDDSARRLMIHDCGHQLSVWCIALGFWTPYGGATQQCLDYGMIQAKITIKMIKAQ